jgi:DNA-directed RNA polymerase specialized sigma24 family protein
MPEAVDFEAFVLKALVLDAEGALLRTAYLLTGDRQAAEDLLTDALAGAHRRWRRVRAGDAPGTVVRRELVRRALRRRAPGRPVPASWTPGDAGPPPTGVAEELRRALLTLPPRTRAALVLRVHDDLPEAETADLLGCSPGTVARLTDEGTAALRTLVGCGPPAGHSPVAPPSTATAVHRAADPDDGDGIYRRPP